MRALFRHTVCFILVGQWLMAASREATRSLLLRQEHIMPNQQKPAQQDPKKQQEQKQGQGQQKDQRPGQGQKK